MQLCFDIIHSKTLIDLSKNVVKTKITLRSNSDKQGQNYRISVERRGEEKLPQEKSQSLATSNNSFSAF